QDYRKAIEVFESILRIDAAHSTAQSMLQEAQAAIKKRDRAQTLIAQAEREFNGGRLTEAYRSILECIQYVPDDSKADALLETIRTAIRDRERQRHLSEGLAKARELLSGSQLEEAQNLLSELNLAYPEKPEIAQIAAEVRSALNEKHKRARIEDGIARAEKALSSKRWSEALGLLEPLTREFPADADLHKVLS